MSIEKVKELTDKLEEGLNRLKDSEEFKKYISDAYEQGKKDGHVVGYYPITTTNQYYDTVTCNAGHSSSSAKDAQ